MFGWLRRRRKRRRCKHHQMPTWGTEGATGDAILRPAVSWVISELIDLGRNKVWTCKKCGQTWFLI